MASPTKCSPPIKSKQQKISERENSVRDRLTGKNLSIDSTASGQRQQSFRAEFSEIYVGSQAFEQLNLNVILAIYLLATERLYEVIIINMDTVEEMDRIYVFEEELTFQMESRLLTLMAEKDNPSPVKKSKSPSKLASEEPHGSPGASTSRSDHSPSKASGSGSGRLPSVTRRDGNSQRVSAELQNAGSNRISSKELSSRRQRGGLDDSESSSRRLPIIDGCGSPGGDSDGESISPPRWSLASRNRRRSDEASGRSNRRVSDDTQARSGRAPRRSSQEFSEYSKDDELMKIISHTTRYASTSRTGRSCARVRNPKTYFNLIKSDKIIPGVDDYTAYSLTDLREDFSRLDSDLSCSTTKGISFFTAVILNFFHVRRQSKNESLFHFILFDGDTKNIFNILPKLPANCEDSTATTEVNPETMISEFRATREWLALCVNGLSSAQQMVEKAGSLEKGAQHVIDQNNQHPSAATCDDSSVNPNKNYYGNKWRDAMQKVGKKLRNHKEIRDKWQSVIDKSKEVQEEEELMNKKMETLKFRSLAVGGNGRGGAALKDMAGNRQNNALQTK